MTKRFLTPILLILTLGLSDLAAQEPRRGIEKTVNELLGIIYGKSTSTQVREKQLSAAIKKRYPLDVVVQRALGRNRSKVSKGELKQIIDLTTTLMIRTYSKRFSGASRPQVSYGKVKELGGGKVELASTAVIQGSKYKVVYRLAKTRSGWQLYDLNIEGVSMVANYRKQFDSHFQRRGTAAQLIAKLQSQIASAR